MRLTPNQQQMYVAISAKKTNVGGENVNKSKSTKRKSTKRTSTKRKSTKRYK